MIRKAPFAALSLAIAIAGCGHNDSSDNGDELLLQEQAAAKQAGARQAQDIVAASMNDMSAGQLSQLQADVETLKASQQGKQVEAMQQQLDDQHAAIVALQSEVDELRGIKSPPPDPASAKTAAKSPAAAKPTDTGVAGAARAPAHRPAGVKPQRQVVAPTRP